MIFASMDGTSWNLLSYITPKSTYPPQICPQPAILPDGKIVVALRSAWPDWRFQWTEIFVSEDNGLTWHFLSRVNEWGLQHHWWC
jgi:hypothetical protein